MFMTTHQGAAMAVGAGWLLGGASAFAQLAPDLAGYMTGEELKARVDAMASGSELASVRTLGQSLGGRAVRLVTLSGSADEAHDRPALLITAGIDGRSLVSTESAVRIAETLVSDHADLLDAFTVYIVPCANPDGMARNRRTLGMGHTGNARLVDEDRDRAIDEDLPDDLNGDGYITLMRRLEPTLDDAPTHMADPDDPRLSIRPDAKDGQRAVFTLYPEGLDNDGDGQINEDGFGSVDLDKNFMHMWPEHEPHAGRYPLSEPEALALATFVIEHPNLVAAVTLGTGDNLISQPESKAKDITGRAPKGIDGADAGLYKRVGEWYEEATGTKDAPKAEAAGSFHAWLYAQRGIPSFAAAAWTRPEPAKGGENVGDDDSGDEPAAMSEADEPKLTPSPIGDISQETLDELAKAYQEMTGEAVDQSMIASITPEMVEQFAAQAGIEIQRVEPEDEGVSQDNAPKKKSKDKKKPKSEEAKWLAYFDEAGVDGFIDWTPFEHPTLGRVEIGGFKPLARLNPPADELDEIAGKQTEFVVRIIGAAPALTVAGPEVKELAQGLYEVRVALINEGQLPTSTAFSQMSRTVRPIVVRLSTPVEQIVSGQRISRVWGVGADGARDEHRWVLRTDDIAAETIEIIDPRAGARTIRLAPSGGGQ